MVTHNVCQHQCSADIILIILDWFCNGLTDCFQTSEVNNSIKCIFIKNFIHGISVKNICFVEFQCFSGNLLYAVQGFHTGIVQIIYYSYFIACV